MNAAIILCGGYSRRLGRDKCRISLGNQTLLGHVLIAVLQTVDTVRVVGRKSQLPSELIPVEFRDQVDFLHDERPELGPLEGLRVGLASLQRSHQMAFACGCDCPLISPRFIEFLFQQAEDFEAVVPQIDGKVLPLPAIYRVNALPHVEAALASGERGLWRMVQRLNARRISPAELETVDPGLKSLINVNDEPTLETVNALWAQRDAQADGLRP